MGSLSSTDMQVSVQLAYAYGLVDLMPQQSNWEKASDLISEISQLEQFLTERAIGQDTTHLCYCLLKLCGLGEAAAFDMAHDKRVYEANSSDYAGFQPDLFRRIVKQFMIYAADDRIVAALPSYAKAVAVLRYTLLKQFMAEYNHRQIQANAPTVQGILAISDQADDLVLRFVCGDYCQLVADKLMGVDKLIWHQVCNMGWSMFNAPVQF